MFKINLNKDWRYCDFDAAISDYEIPAGSKETDLPFDMLTQCEKDFSSIGAEYNGYVASHNICLFKKLPKLEKVENVILDIHGVGGLCEVFLNGTALKIIPYPSRYYIDLTPFLSKDGNNLLKLSITNFTQSGKYTGLGIAGGVSLLTSSNPVRISADGVFVKTVKIDSKAQLLVSAQVKNDLPLMKRVTLCAEIFNGKNKRVTKKTRKIRLPSHLEKVFELSVKRKRFYTWDSYDPNLYNVKVSILDDEAGGKELDCESCDFGIVTKSVSSRSLVINNNPLKLKGAVVMHDNGILGNVSQEGAEIYKLARIKELGFNAVRYIGCPSDAVLFALDKLGLMCVVDIFDVLKRSKFIMDGHAFFESEFEAVTVAAVKTLRKHPCVVLYGVANNAEESYGRGDLKDVCHIVDLIKATDPFAIVYANAFERLPSQSELDKFDVKLTRSGQNENVEKRMLSAAREKDLFKNCTADYFSHADVAGYSFLHARYLLDKNIPGRLILGTASERDKAFDTAEETEKNSNVLGDFMFAATDFLGSMPMLDKDASSRLRPSVCNSGLLDKTYRKKDLAWYNEIVLGKKGARILVKDPDLETESADNEFTMLNSSHLWNWPKSIGKPVTVRVLTSGEIVALTLDGKAVGRKLAGKFNRNYADFKTNFYPGRLEAVSFHKGLEQSRVSLESVTSPKMLKIECFTKSVKGGDLCYFDVAVTDKEGRVVPYAMRNIEISIEGEGKLIVLGNGDPEHFSSHGSSICPTFNGYITGVLKATTEGKALIKATSEGLLAAKATIKVK